jgi:DNA-binding MarR family transcriptional regulator
MPAKNKKTDSKAGRYAYEGLDRIMHEKARLGILTSLVSRPEGVLFNDLKELCSLTDGNLSRHLQTLQEAGLVEVWKGYHNKRPQTLCRLSEQGRERFMEYLAQLEKVVRDAAAVREQAKDKGAARDDVLSEGWASA